MESIDYSPAGPTVEAFHKSNAFVRGLMGPVGSSKSSACCIEIFDRACRQTPHNGIRKSKWAAIRNTYGELETTTLQTWLRWFPISKMNYGAPITAVIDLPLPDKTRVHLEVLFFPVDRPEEIKKLKSLELTGAWINEAAEIAKSVVDMCTQRVGRYPPVIEGGPNYYGVIMDTNPPDDDHWYYTMAEREKPEGWEFFRQPGALLVENEKYLPNPLAENLPNIIGGYEYWIKQIPGKAKEWIKVFLLGQYGTISDGRPVYPEYYDELHCKTTTPYPNLPLLLGFDYGLTPACVICQISPRGQLLVLGELFAKDMGIRQFATDIVKPHLALTYPKFSFQAVGDPAGVARKDTDEKTCFMELAECGIPAVPASTNTFLARREAVVKYLTKLVDGKGGLQIDPKCEMLRRGFNGRYNYKRLQVVGAERFKDIPDKNDYSHVHDALQYAALYSQTMQNTTEWSKPIKYPKKTGIV